MAKLKCSHDRRVMTVNDGGKIVHRSDGSTCFGTLTFAGTPVTAERVTSVGASMARMPAAPPTQRTRRRDKSAEKLLTKIYSKDDV